MSDYCNGFSAYNAGLNIYASTQTRTNEFIEGWRMAEKAALCVPDQILIDGTEFYVMGGPVRSTTN